jgi:hypothetical protein
MCRYAGAAAYHPCQAKARFGPELDYREFKYNAMKLIQKKMKHRNPSLVILFIAYYLLHDPLSITLGFCYTSVEG